jgi:hypothetical protein
LTCLPSWITSMVPQHDNKTSSACAALAATIPKASATAFSAFSKYEPVLPVCLPKSAVSRP